MAACGTWVVCHTRSNSERSIGRATWAAGINLNLVAGDPGREGWVGGEEQWGLVRVGRVGVPGADGSYLVDPASSHMLVSKIKPCMSKYKLLIL